MKTIDLCRKSITEHTRMLLWWIHQIYFLFEATQNFRPLLIISSTVGYITKSCAFARKMIFESIYHCIHMALSYHQSNSWLVPVALLVLRNFVDTLLQLLATVYSGYRHGFLVLCSQPRNKEISPCIADALGTHAIQSLQSKWTVGENPFNIVKKCWNISNNDHHVQS